MNGPCFGKPELVERCTTCDRRIECLEHQAECRQVFLLLKPRPAPREVVPTAHYVKEETDVKAKTRRRGPAKGT
ncbi:hypothetical protein LCGC14_1356140 [marine sediment metagenome]|uniref:Uncharacterized protein n=1 Tax=marine sediment metagenome TaxID=412755 RepID=A0A0F9K9F6_9ZZZZ